MPIFPRDAAAGAATQEFFIPATYGNTQVVQGDFPTYGAFPSGNTAYMAFKVPHDFASMDNAEIIFISKETDASRDYQVDTDYGAVGEAYTTHSETTGVVNMALVLNQIMGIDISGQLAALAADDCAGVKFENKENANFFVIGLRFRYS